MVRIVNNSSELIALRDSIPSPQRVGFVPTMGNLHSGHLSLLKEALHQQDCAILSIFVNPKQFGPQEDFTRYPRTLEQDIEKIVNFLKIEGDSFKGQREVIVFAPSGVREIFPADFSTSISVGPMSKILCGEQRPTHFDGVTTVVYKLFSIVRPHVAYFGQKDLQQLVIIKKMVRDLDLPVGIIGLPICRDSDGLALSSRNQFLQGEERSQALTLPHKLIELALYVKNRVKSFPNKIEELKDNKTLKQIIDKTRLDPHWDYLKILDGQTLSLPTNETKELAILGAYRVNKTRLIDNIVIDLTSLES